MKILMVNKFLYPKGGSETYVFKLGKILEEKGNEVQYFGLDNPQNIVGNHAKQYVSEQDFKKGIKKNLTAPFKIIYSSEARSKINKVLLDFKPDIVHLNNIQFHLTPSIILGINKWRKSENRNCKIIYTAHDFQLICPSHGLFDSNLDNCERCLKGNFFHCLKTKCIKNSRMKSMLGTMEAFYWKYSKAYSFIDTIICPSQFLKNKLDSQEHFRDKTIKIHNFVDEVEPLNVEKEDYILEFGKLCKDKGTYTLLEVAKKMKEKKFIFAGYGDAVTAIQDTENAEYVGFKTGEELKSLISKAAVSILPSEIHENCPFSVIESQMYLTPVIGSKMGGTPELLEEGRTGELFTAGDAEELEMKIRKIMSDPGYYKDNCKSIKIETCNSYYEKLLKIYNGDQI